MIGPCSAAQHKLSKDISLDILDSIEINNSSFEDVPHRGGENIRISIEGWFDCGKVQFKHESPPDIHPTPNAVWEVDKVAVDGQTYLGMVVRDNDSWDALTHIAQIAYMSFLNIKLSTNLVVF